VLFGGWSEANMEPSWKHADVFPIIACVIDHAYREHHRFITAQEIAARLLQDSQGRNMIEAAREQQQEQQSLEWLASNMVAWFSQRITIGDSDWARAFERKKIDGLWAYKPVSRSDPQVDLSDTDDTDLLRFDGPG
jgi:hypothetical protein